MDVFLKATAGVLITLVLYLVLSKQSKDLAILLSMAVCCMTVVAAVSYFQPVINFFERLQTEGKLNADMMRILLKSVGVGMLAELASMICTDGGNSALGKAIKVLGTAVILWMSIPLFNKLLELIEDILVMV